MKTLEERFWNKVNKTAGCWLWIGGANPDGYGHIKINGHMFGAHRLSWKLANGEIPEGMEVCHSCDTPNCVKPEHLFLGTHKENMEDAIRKGRFVYPVVTDENKFRKGQPAYNKGVPFSEEAKKNMSDSHKGRAASEETKSRMSEAHKGRPTWNKGVTGYTRTPRKS